MFYYINCIHCFPKLSILGFQITSRMSKRQKLSFFPLGDLPDEILLKIFSYMNIKGVLQCGKVSMRLRAVSNDQSLWLKLNLFRRDVPYGFIEKAVQNGCEYLNLRHSCVYIGEKSGVPWKLKYLDISQSDDRKWTLAVPEGVLENCHVLQKLSVDNLMLDSVDIDQICQNGETLQILSLEGCQIDSCQRTELIEKLFKKCPHLTELNINKGAEGAPINKIFFDETACALVDNLTPNILKLNLGSHHCVEDKHVNSLVRRCNKLTELDLSGTSITNDSIESIVEHLTSLEKLDVGYTYIDVPTLLQLKSIPTLKVLRFFHWKNITKEMKNLKLQLPNISINKEYLHIACPKNKMNRFVDQDWFWEIRAKQQMWTLFLKAH